MKKMFSPKRLKLEKIIALPFEDLRYFGFIGTVNTPIITAVIIVFNPLFRFGGGYNSREGTIMKFFLTNDTSETF